MITKRNSVSIPLLGIAFVIILAACSRGEGGPTVIMTGTMGLGTLTHTDSVPSLYPSTGSPTPIITPTTTNAQTPTMQPGISPTKTSITPGYVLKDWRESTEVITPENMDRVERIGQLVFNSGIVMFTWSPEGSFLGVSLLIGDYVLDATTFEKKFFLEGGAHLAFSYDGRILETGGMQFNMLTGRESSGDFGTVRFEPGRLREVEFSPNGDYVVAAGSSYAYIYPMTSAVRITEFGRKGAEQLHASVSPDGRLIALDYEYENFVELWNPYSRKPIRRLKIKDMSSGGNPIFNKKENHLYTIGWGKWNGEFASFIQEWDYITGTIFDIQILPERLMGDGMNMDVSTISRVVGIGTIDGKLYLLSQRSCTAYSLNRTGSEEIETLAFRTDGKLLATAGRDMSTIELWGIPEKEATPTVELPTGTPTTESIVCPKIPKIIEYPVLGSGWFAY
jgi:WD40 repeat protein